MMTSVNEKQVGGSHYKSAYQHWDLVIKHNLHYLLGCASKYITRRKSNRIEDLEKAVHYIEKAIEAKIRPAYLPDDLEMTLDKIREDVGKFAMDNGLSYREFDAVYKLCIGDFEGALVQTKCLLDEVRF